MKTTLQACIYIHNHLLTNPRQKRKPQGQKEGGDSITLFSIYHRICNLTFKSICIHILYYYMLLIVTVKNKYSELNSYIEYRIQYILMASH